MVGSDFQLINGLALGLWLEFITLYLVYIFDDINNYSVDKMMLVSLNLYEYCMPTSAVSLLTLYIRLQNTSFRD